MPIDQYKMVFAGPYPSPNHPFGSYFVVYNDDENSHLYKTFSLYTWTFDQHQIATGETMPFLETQPTYYEFAPSDYYGPDVQTYYYPQTEHEFTLLPWKFRMGTALPSGEIVHDLPILVFPKSSLLPNNPPNVFEGLECKTPENHAVLEGVIQIQKPNDDFPGLPKYILVFLAFLYAITFYMFLFKH